jgi:hypothetical protein
MKTISSRLTPLSQTHERATAVSESVGARAYRDHGDELQSPQVKVAVRVCDKTVHSRLSRRHGHDKREEHKSLAGRQSPAGFAAHSGYRRIRNPSDCRCVYPKSFGPAVPVPKALVGAARLQSDRRIGASEILVLTNGCPTRRSRRRRWHPGWNSRRPPGG